MKKKITKILTIFISILASICFFIKYFIGGKDMVYLILGIAWICISICYGIEILSDKQK